MEKVDTDSQSVKSFGLDSGCDSLSCVDDLLDVQKDFRVSGAGWADIYDDMVRSVG